MTEALTVGDIVDGYRVISMKGTYIRIELPEGHVLAEARGRSYLHRIRCFESLGCPHVSPCHWCGYKLPWKHEDGQRFVINVDHLNEDPTDNSPANLVPSCWWCNANRSWGEVLPDWWNGFVARHAEMHPAERPRIPEMFFDAIKFVRREPTIKVRLL